MSKNSGNGNSILTLIVFILIIFLLIVLVYMLSQTKDLANTLNDNLSINHYINMFNNDVCNMESAICPDSPGLGVDYSKCLPTCTFIRMARYTCENSDTVNYENNSICRQIMSKTVM